MALTHEQAENIKKQLMPQIEKLPQENKEQIKEYIKQLNPEQLEEFLKQNKIQISSEGNLAQSTAPGTDQQTSEKPIFQSIVEGEIPSYKIDENNKAIAILEINPLSKGHSIILPKENTGIEKISKSALSLAQKIAKKIKTKLKPQDIKIETSSFQDYPMINIIPIYKDTQLEKKKESEQELEKLQSKLKVKKRGPRNKKENTNEYKKNSNLPEIGFRIP